MQVICCIFQQFFWPQVPRAAQAHPGVSTCDPESQGDCRQWPPVLASGSEQSARSELGKDGIPPVKMTHSEWIQKRYQHTMKQTGSQALKNQTSQEFIPDSRKPHEDKVSVNLSNSNHYQEKAYRKQRTDHLSLVLDFPLVPNRSSNKQGTSMQ